MSNELLDIVKNRLDRTWQDDKADQKLLLIINNGISELDRMSGIENDYTKAGQAQSLLFAYVMYDLSASLDDFKKNYRSDLISFINHGKVKRYVESKKTESSRDV